MHIAVFLQHYHTPDCPTGARPFSLIQRLARDHQVTVITTRTWYERRLAHNFPWTPTGVDMRMLEVPYRNAMTSRQRLWAYLRYAAQAFTEGLQIRRPDLIWGSSTPLSAAIAAAAVARFRSVPWIFEVRDLWPAFPIQMGAISNPMLISILQSVERRLYQSAAHVVALSPDMTSHIRQTTSGASVSTIEYGTELNLMDRVYESHIQTIRSDFGLPSSGIALYAGTFGRANAIPMLLDTARQLTDRKDLHFVLTGHGYYQSAVQETAHELPNLTFIPPQPQPRALTLFRLADVSLVPFIDLPVLKANAPSKLYDSLAAGTPVIVTNAGWTKDLVETNHCGWYVPPTSPEQLADRITSLFDEPGRLTQAGQRGAAVARQRFDRSVQMDRLAALVNQVGIAQ
jgi:glycosyltransferase involved in cell wall biosynthesis